MAQLDERVCMNNSRQYWYFETIPFSVSEDIWEKKRLTMVLNGIDTYAILEFNGLVVDTLNNAFRTWTYNVKPLLKRTDNVIRLRFVPDDVHAKEVLNFLPYPIPGDSLRAVIRKPQFHFGWDWAPRLNTCGIARDIQWLVSDELEVLDFYVEQLEVNEESASLRFNISGNAFAQADISVEVTCLDNSQQWSGFMKVHDSAWVIQIPAVINNPLLWNCNGIGFPNMTSFMFKVYANHVLVSSQIVTTGLRSLKLIKDEMAGGVSFGFELNGVSVFAKGANYIPLNYYPGTTTMDEFETFLMKCRDANMNMIRVWGGGYYEDDNFYHLCDRYGIMVWHDFMFACSMYPGDEAFVENIKREAMDQVIRLRNHPCIALWCGNNEVAEGWARWGWKDGLSELEQNALSKAYTRVFDEVLPEVVYTFSRTSYHHSSPLFGRGDIRSQSEGDMHDWGIWHDELPLEEFGKRVPRFMSEFGMQSFPSTEVLFMMSRNSFNENDSTFIRYQRHPRGFRLMRSYAERWYPGCSNLNYRDYSLVTQAVQAEGIINAIHHHRVHQPHCSGSLFWQLNDVWPSFSWSAIDFAKNEKLLFKMLQEAFAPQTLVAIVENDSLKIFWLSDRVCDHDSAHLYLRWNKPGELLDIIPRSINEFVDPSYPCSVQMGVKLLYAESINKELGVVDNVDLTDWTLDCAIQIKGQEDLQFVRKFRPMPGSRQMIIPDTKDYNLNGKDASLNHRKLIFKKL